MTNKAFEALATRWRTDVLTIDTTGDWGKAMALAYSQLTTELEAVIDPPENACPCGGSYRRKCRCG